ncbi:MAG TPA: UDP-N-acetylmuramoyl-L-alanine--D-glutamate ligase [Acidimicrobiales bacterium]|nr:UDP-N-acetylmuramoyl-L-alanine--D-glutamate ligase [Acidimicrobiales bacterium]
MTPPPSARTTGLDRLRVPRVAVWGTGVEGREAAEAALERGAQVVFVDDRSTDASELPVGGVEIPVLAPSALAEGSFDCIVRSPGVSVYREELRKARASGAEVTSVTAMWLEDFSGSRVVAVTGTKGKTTTAWLAAIVLEACGLRVRLGGNMGTPLTALYREEPGDVYVVEVSSFQAADVQVSPPVGVLTLLAPDHLDWHGSYDRYVRDKLNLFDHRADVTLAVSSASPDAVASTARYERRILYGSEGRVVVEDSAVTVDGEPVLDLTRTALGLRGAHNLVNLCGAISACLLETGGIPKADALAEALGHMPVLPNRLETVASARGVEYVNDALASNPAGTVAALRTFAGRRICLILGGQDRGVDLAPLLEELHRTRPVPSIVYLPDLGDRLCREISASGSSVECRPAPSVDEAARIASGILGEEGVVLFSPAAPTPIVEGTYVQRGAAFNRAVAELVSSGS